MVHIVFDIISNEQLEKLTLKRQNDDSLSEDELQEICDCVEMFDDDVSLAYATSGDTSYEVCTTHGRHNLYLIESELHHNKIHTAEVQNISCKIKELRTRDALLKMLSSLNYKNGWRANE